LRKRFAPPSTELTAFSNLVQCQQKSGERVAEFCQRLQLWCSKSELGDIDQLMLRFFLSGLRPTIRNAVLMKNPTTFEEALNQAQYAEGCEALTARSSARTFAINFGSYSQNTEVECYFCHRLGHMRRDCDRYARYLNNFRNPVDYGGYHGSNANSQGYRNKGNNMRGGRSYGDVLVGSSETNANREPQEWNDCYRKTAKFNTDEAPRQNDSWSDSDPEGDARGTVARNDPNADGARPPRR